MSGRLSDYSYGKSRVRLTKVTRHADHHDLAELTVAIQLEGDFAESWITGDNSRIVATDTMKNTVYALAREHALSDPESFALTLAGHFLERNNHVSRALVEIVEEPWTRLHPHAFVGGGCGRRTVQVDLSRGGRSVAAGIEGLMLLKTTDSAFRGFLRDEYTTLPETDDRIFATELTTRWQYGRDPADWNAAHASVRRALLETFAQHQSLAVQQTLYDMGLAALDACAEVGEIRLSMPNRHRLLMDLSRFGQDNPNMIFVATDEPHGLIHGTVRRA
jgi:urate oxidase